MQTTYGALLLIFIYWKKELIDMGKVSLEEAFILLPKLMIYKNQKDSIGRKLSGNEILLDAKEIFKVLDLNPESRVNYLLLEKWCSPQYQFLRKVKDVKPYKYAVEDKNFWNYIRKRSLYGLTFFDYIQTKITILEM